MSAYLVAIIALTAQAMAGDEQNYPPATVDFSSMIRAIRAAKPDLVFVMSYPNDSVAIMRAVNEIGVGSSVKIFGGGMVGLSAATFLARAPGRQIVEQGGAVVTQFPPGTPPGSYRRRPSRTAG